MCDAMGEMEMMKRRIKDLESKLSAVSKYLKMEFKYTPEMYEMVKPEELTKGDMIPMQV